MINFKMKKKTKYIMVGTLLVLAIITAYIFWGYCEFKTISKALKSISWHQTQATVLYCTANQGSQLIQNFYRDTEKPLQTIVYMKYSESLTMAYRYTYQGKSYTSSRYSFAYTADGTKEYTNNTPTNRFKKIADQNPPGKQISCFVNPNNPAEAVISRNLQPQDLLSIGIWILIFITASTVALFIAGWAFVQVWKFRNSFTFGLGIIVASVVSGLLFFSCAISSLFDFYINKTSVTKTIVVAAIVLITICTSTFFFIKKELGVENKQLMLKTIKSLSFHAGFLSVCTIFAILTFKLIQFLRLLLE